MEIRDHFASSGAWLFRWRSYLPVLFFGIVLVGVPEAASLTPGQGRGIRWELFCMALGTVGLLFRILTVGCAPSGTSGRNTHGQLAAELNTTGTYSLVRHPLYVGNYFMWLGVALLPGQPWIVAVVTLVFWLYYERIIFAEEEFLRRKFGDAFTAWARRTPAFIPRLRGWRRPALPFCWRTALRREYQGAFGFVAAVSVFEALEDVVGARGFRGDVVWATLSAAAALAYLAIRLIARRTRILHVRGR